ncbi:MAG: two-component system sensor histidine kinase NtrB [Sphaerochaeta sp.]
MSQFVKKASSKIEKLSSEEILRIIETQNFELKIRNSVLDNSFEGSIIVGEDGNVLYLNSPFLSLVPTYPGKKYTGLSLSRIIISSDILSFMKNFLSSEDKTVNEFFDLEDKGEGIRSLNCSAEKLGDPKCCLFIFRDITFFNRFKDEFRKNESLAQMTTMAAGVAHEIKNPLASISIYLQLMDKMLEKKGSVTREEAHKYLDVVGEEVERINKIAVDFLFAVKPMKVNLAICSLNDIVSKTVKLAAAELREKNIALKVNLATSLPKVYADSALIEQSILNLIKNAMQAMPEDRVKPVITVSTFMDSDMVKLSVSDNGCGMTEDQMSKIFEPYFTTKSSGTGLGLTVLFKIMKQHGGDVHVRSVYGEGTELTLQIPVPQTERFRLTDGGKA